MRCVTHGLSVLALAALAVTSVHASSFSGLAKRQVAEVESTLGCNATGPLGGKWAVDVSPCVAGQKYTCAITDATGCAPYDTSKIELLIATSLVTGPCQPLSGAASISSTEFTCPAEEFAACTATLHEDYGIPFGLSVTPS